MALIDCVSWLPSDNRTLVYRYPEENLSTYTQLIVNESQEAILISKGQMLGKFGPGKHTLDTENLPFLRKFFGIPFGGKNPFQATVFFFNKTQSPTIDWETTPFKIFDPNYGTSIPIIAKGRMGVHIENAEKLLLKIVGNVTRSFTTSDLADMMWGELTSALNQDIAAFMSANNLGVMSITTHLRDFARCEHPEILNFLTSCGFLLDQLYVTSIDIDDTTEEGRIIRDAVTSRSAQSIAGYSWQQQKAFDTVNNAVNNGGKMGMLGVALMMGGGMGGGMGAGMMQGNVQMNPVTNPNMGAAGNVGAPGMPGQTGAMGAVPREVFCSHCAKRFPMTSKFCPFCGNQYNPCPRCGSDNNPRARVCVSCGTPLASAGGPAMSDASNCSRCGAPVGMNVKFCPACGNKVR